MKAILERLFALRGIRAAVAFDKNGQLLASHGDALAPALERMGATFMSTLSGATSPFAATVSATVLHFEGGVMVIRRNQDVMLVVVGDATFDATERGSAVPFNVALVALRVGSRRPPRQSVTVPADGSNPPPEVQHGALKTPKTPTL